MFLKSMEMFGFKSFGPNGCGKSNIVDAIKWVLGEKQARNIRGQTMEDVIFSGTDLRKPLSLAEVSMTLDNGGRVLEIESDSVTVTRRIFRDGESEYLINKSPVRLKDIEKLFMDTGIGKSAYSVMEQGKMDLILSTKAEDRRYIFEEAAGISRYKLQKRESLRKLKDTSENLNRLNDVIKEIEREKDLKAKQSEKTKEYLKHRSDQIELDIKMNYLKFVDLQRKQDKIQFDLEKLKKDKDVISERVSSISQQNEKDEKRKNDLQHQLFEDEKKMHAYKIRVEDIDQKTEKNKNQIVEQENRVKIIEKKKIEREETLNRLVDEKATAEKNGIEKQKKIIEDKERLGNLFETRTKKLENIRKYRDQIESHKNDIVDKEAKLINLRNSLEEVVKRLVDAIDQRKAELQDSEYERQNVRDEIHNSLREMDDILNRVLRDIKNGMTDEAVRLLTEIDVIKLNDNVSKFESYEDGFRSILFDKTGIHAEKENIDIKIKRKVTAIDEYRSEISMFEERIEDEQKELETINEMVTLIEKELSKNETEGEWIEKHLYSLNGQIGDIKKQIDNYLEDTERSDKIILGLKKEIEGWEERLLEFNERSESLFDTINQLKEKREELEKKVDERKTSTKKDQEDFNRLVERISAFDKSLVEIIFKKNNIEDYLWTEYEKKVSSLKKLSVDETQLQGFLDEFNVVKQKIQQLGPINNLAIEEFKDLKKRFEYYVEQKTDIEKARSDIFSVIEDINKTSIDMFVSTFKQIQKNFSEIFKQLFEGGEAELELVDIDNVLESGIDIMVRPPGKKAKNINLLSGGERALTATALLFATYMVRPSPFCFLDEIDAPLDEENIGRFIRMMKEFSKSTQFVEPGASKIISLRMEGAKKEVEAKLD